MTDMTPCGARQEPSEYPGGNSPSAGRWYAHGIVHEQNTGWRYGITTGTYQTHPKDIEYLGLLDFLVRPEGTIERTDTDAPTTPEELPAGYFQASDISAQTRAIIPMKFTITRRRQALLDLTVAAAAASIELTGERWQTHRNDPAFVTANQTQGHLSLTPFRHARTERRRTVVSRLPETWDVRQSKEGRPNPNSTRAVLAMVSDRLIGQLDFDDRSERSMGRRTLICHDKLRADWFQLAMIARLFAAASSDVIKAELPGLLRVLCAVPAVYVTSYLDWMMLSGQTEIERRHWREYAIKAIDAEYRLDAFNAVLSNLRDDPQLIDRATLNVQRSMLEAIAFDGAYSSLASRLQDYLRILEAAATTDNRTIGSVQKVVRTMKVILRSRYMIPVTDNPTAYPWTVRPAVDEYGEPIWVAAARFGARPQS